MTKLYTLNVDWPDATPAVHIRCDLAELQRNLAMLPHWLGEHPPFAAPLMIEIHLLE